MRTFSVALTALCLALAAFAASAQQDLEPAVQTSPAAAPVSPTPPKAAAAAVKPGTVNSTSHSTGKPAAPAVTPAGGTTAGAGATSKGATPGDRMQLDTTQISGNRELPRVMYVVPWRRADPGEFTGRPLNSLLDEALKPVDRDVFRRQNRYYSELSGDPGSARSQPGAAGQGSAAPTPKDEK